MILDIIVLSILTIPAALGLFRGFAHTFLYTLGWIGALLGSLLLTKLVAAFFRDGFVGDMIFERLRDKFTGSASALETALEGLPQIISGGLAVTEEEHIEMFAEMLTSVLVIIVTFVLLFFLIRIALGTVVRSMIGGNRMSLLKGANKLLGFVAGFIEGVILVFVFLALLVPLTDLAAQSASATLVDSLETSVIAGSLYDNNLLLLVTGGFFS